MKIIIAFLISFSCYSQSKFISVKTAYSDSLIILKTVADRYKLKEGQYLKDGSKHDKIIRRNISELRNELFRILERRENDSNNNTSRKDSTNKTEC